MKSLALGLEPVDPSRPRFTYRPIEGFGCGPDGLIAALHDMRRLRGVDGYERATVKRRGRGGGMLTRVTAYPFTYGSEPKPISLRAAATDELGAPDEHAGLTSTSR